ncbi:MAG: PmoA family protein [Cyclobacteriaceae bacterium]
MMNPKNFLFLMFLLCSLTFQQGICQQVSFVQTEEQINIMAGDKMVSSYKIGEDLLKPYLFPIRSPSGEVVTRGYPIQEIQGESKDHPHHTGLYFTYGSKEEVNGNSFWNLHEIPPQIKHMEVLEIEEGRNKGHLTTLSHWIGKDHQALLSETRKMEFSVQKNRYIFDFDIILKALDRTVTFGDTKEGMFAIRVADWLAEKSNHSEIKNTGEYLNAEGDRTESNIWGKRSSWVRLEGEKDGKRIGIAMYHHPESTNYPTYWHARGYGCFAANPIGQFDFQKGNQTNAPEKRTLKLQPGEEARFKFRVTIYEGDRSFENFNQEFKNFSRK